MHFCIHMRLHHLYHRVWRFLIGHVHQWCWGFCPAIPRIECGHQKRDVCECIRVSYCCCLLLALPMLTFCLESRFPSLYRSSLGFLEPCTETSSVIVRFRQQGWYWSYLDSPSVRAFVYYCHYDRAKHLLQWSVLWSSPHAISCADRSEWSMHSSIPSSWYVSNILFILFSLTNRSPTAACTGLRSQLRFGPVSRRQQLWTP